MRRLSVRALVIFLPIGVACILAVRQHLVVAARTMAVEQCRRAIALGIDAPVISVTEAFGNGGSARVLTELASISNDVAFDRGRWAQILRARNARPRGEGDGYILGDVKGRCMHSFALPKGAAINRISFDGKRLNMWIHGEKSQGDYHYTIPATNPQKYHVAWLPHGPLSTLQAMVYEMIAADHCIPEPKVGATHFYVSRSQHPPRTSSYEKHKKDVF